MSAPGHLRPAPLVRRRYSFTVDGEVKLRAIGRVFHISALASAGFGLPTRNEARAHDRSRNGAQPACPVFGTWRTETM